MTRQALVSPTQSTLTPTGFPFDIPMTSEAFTGLWIGAFWELENLALFNQAAYTTVEARNLKLNTQAAEVDRDEKAGQAITDEVEADAFERAVYQRKNLIYNGELEVAAITRYADEVTIVATWAFVEKHLNEALRLLQGAMNIPQHSSHRWPDINAAFLALGIDLSQLPCFSDADECRRVNNAIKHSGMVSSSLAALPAFSGQVGLKLAALAMDTQRYYLNAGGFIAAAVERASDLAYPNQP